MQTKRQVSSALVSFRFFTQLVKLTILTQDEIITCFANDISCFSCPTCQIRPLPTFNFKLQLNLKIAVGFDFLHGEQEKQVFCGFAAFRKFRCSGRLRRVQGGFAAFRKFRCSESSVYNYGGRNKLRPSRLCDK